MQCTYLKILGINLHVYINKSNGYYFVGLFLFPNLISIKISLIEFKR